MNDKVREAFIAYIRTVCDPVLTEYATSWNAKTKTWECSDTRGCWAVWLARQPEIDALTEQRAELERVVASYVSTLIQWKTRQLQAAGMRAEDALINARDEFENPTATAYENRVRDELVEKLANDCLAKYPIYGHLIAAAIREQGKL